jgi:cob(I)alamin adenosyltransferase
MKIYTKTGDKGETGLLGGERVPKNSLRINAYGTVDELNSFIGLALNEVKEDSIKAVLSKIQNQLFVLGTDLAAPETEKKIKIDRVPREFSEEIEKVIDKYESELVQLKNFILPGGSRGAAILHVCRTIARRAEREVVALNFTEKIDQNIIIFLNRISDLFFVLARFENKVSNIPDALWDK